MCRINRKGMNARAATQVLGARRPPKKTNQGWRVGKNGLQCGDGGECVCVRVRVRVRTVPRGLSGRRARNLSCGRERAGGECERAR